MIEAQLIKRADGLFQGATAYDVEQLGYLKMGQGYKVKITQGSNRSVQHHRLFFGGLLPLAFQYWQPSGGLVNESEEKAVLGFARTLDALSGQDGFVPLAEQFLARLAQSRADKLDVPPARDLEQFRKWLMVQAGYFDVVETPSGVRKVAQSIAFHKMNQEEFNAFYQNCFDVAWRLFLNTRFDDEEQAQQAALELLAVGQ